MLQLKKKILAHQNSLIISGCTTTGNDTFSQLIDWIILWRH